MSGVESEFSLKRIPSLPYGELYQKKESLGRNELEAQIHEANLEESFSSTGSDASFFVKPAIEVK